MRQPLWLLNLCLFLGLIFTLVFIFVSKIQAPAKKSILVDEYITETKETSEKMDYSNIYKNDLFNTVKESLPEENIEPKKISLPEPPKAIAPKKPEKPQVKFLDPLSVTLTGIIYFGDKNLNRAIILDNRTKVESIYKFEDEVEDAQIISILSDKVILLRSNSQQEILYLNEQINPDEKNILQKNWSHIVTKKSDNLYNIDVKEFGKVIKNLSDLIFTFNLKTISKNNKPLGLAVGELENNSLAEKMGLASGDLIESINNITLKTQNDRLEAYNKITSENPAELELQIQSGNSQKIIRYKLKNTDQELLKKEIDRSLNNYEIQENHKKLTDTLKDAKERDKQIIFNRNQLNENNGQIKWKKF